MKKYYRLRKNLPTFNKGELFYIDSCGNLRRVKDNKNYDGTLIDIIELCGEEEDDEVQS